MQEVLSNFLTEENRAIEETKGNVTEETVNAHFFQVQPRHYH